MWFGTSVRGGEVYVCGPDGDLRVGPLDAVVTAVGGPAWTITYSEWQRRRYPHLDTSDEGIVVDVCDFVDSMTCPAWFVEALAALPDERVNRADPLSPRLGLFVGHLVRQLEFGLE